MIGIQKACDLVRYSPDLAKVLDALADHADPECLGKRLDCSAEDVAETIRALLEAGIINVRGVAILHRVCLLAADLVEELDLLQLEAAAPSTSSLIDWIHSRGAGEN